MKDFDFNNFLSDYEKKVAQADLLSKQLSVAIGEIEKYKEKLFGLWSPQIDFSFIGDSTLRYDLEKDCRRMAIVRSGISRAPVEERFADFCGYAFLQIEGVISYYYNSITDSNLVNYNKLRSFVIAMWNASNEKQFSASPVSNYQFGNMFFLFGLEYNLKNNHRNIFNIIKNLENYRNTRLFHRGVINNSSLADYEKENLTRFLSEKNYENVDKALVGFCNIIALYFHHTISQ